METDNLDNLYEETRQRAAGHLLERLAQVEVSDKPFPHFFVTELLPGDIYAKLIKSFPDLSCYSTYDKYNQGAEITRRSINLTRESLANMAPEKRALWLGVRDALGGLEVKQIIFQRFRHGLARRFHIAPEEVKNIPAYPLPALYRETAGYKIKPHPDTRKKIVTMQIALPADESQADLGTAFYRLTPNPAALLKHPKGFKKVKQMPFLPNSAYAFVVFNTLTTRSWHGCEELRPDCGVRNSLLHLYYGDRERGNQELVDLYYREN